MSSLLGCLLLAALMPGGGPLQENEERRIPLTATKLEKGSHLLGRGLDEVVGGTFSARKAYAAEIDGFRVLFFDLDRNRRLNHRDGMGLAEFPFVVSLPEELLVSSGQYSYRFDGLKALLLRRTELELDPAIFPSARTLTEVRIRAGLRPLVLENEASEAARSHLDYLNVNEIVRDGVITMEAHRENPRRAGYSAGGRHAGAHGLLGCGRSLSEDAMAWYASAFHGIKLLDPALQKVGVARRHGLSLVCPPAGYLGPLGEEGLQLHPPDGAREVPSNFSRGGEVPSPLPEGSGAGAGFPIFVRLPRSSGARHVASLQVRNASGEVVPGYLSTPRKPVSSIFPTNMDCAIFIPSTRLEDGETYRVTFTLENGARPLDWSFRTWEWRAERR